MRYIEASRDALVMYGFLPGTGCMRLQVVFAHSGMQDEAPCFRWLFCCVRSLLRLSFPPPGWRLMSGSSPPSPYPLYHVFFSHVFPGTWELYAIWDEANRAVFYFLATRMDIGYCVLGTGLRWDVTS